MQSINKQELLDVVNEALEQSGIVRTLTVLKVGLEKVECRLDKVEQGQAKLEQGHLQLSVDLKQMREESHIRWIKQERANDEVKLISEVVGGCRQSREAAEDIEARYRNEKHRLDATSQALTLHIADKNIHRSGTVKRPASKKRK